MKDRIGIFIYEYALGNSPSLINAAKGLVDAGYYVDFFTFRTLMGDFRFDDPRITVHQFQQNFLERPVADGLYKRLSEVASEKMFHARRALFLKKVIEKEVRELAGKAASMIDKGRYKCLVGAEPGGLAAAAEVCQAHGLPLVYYNLELYLSSEAGSPIEDIFKRFEIEHNGKAAFTITQSDERAALIAKDNGIGLASIVTIPVCAEGPAFREKSDALRKKLNIPEDSTIVLYAGYIADWAMCEEMAKAASSWPKDKVLVLHSHGLNSGPYMQKVEKYAGETVRISLNPVSYEELSAFLSSADIGIALYKNLGTNFTLMNSASGKLAHYLRSGLPVIVNDYPSLEKLVGGYGCGRCVQSPDGILPAVERILEGYEDMRKNAFRCYEDNFIFSRRFSRILERIEKL